MSTLGIILAAVITFIILLVGIIMFGAPLLYIIYAANGAFVEWLTSKFGKTAREHTSRFGCLVVLFVFLEIILIFSAIYGAYKLVSSLISDPEIISAAIDKPVHSFSTLQFIVIILISIKSFQLGRYLYYTIRFYRNHKESIDPIYYKNLRDTLISYLLVYTYLIGFYLFFNNASANDLLGVLPSIAGCLFLPYLLFHLCKSGYAYIKYRKQIFPNFGFKDVLNLLPFFVFDFGFLYFFYITAQYLWIF